jgi:hypothetical protein
MAPLFSHKGSALTGRNLSNLFQNLTKLFFCYRGSRAIAREIYQNLFQNQTKLFFSCHGAICTLARGNFEIEKIPRPAEIK